MLSYRTQKNMSTHHALDPLTDTSQSNKSHDPLRATWGESATFDKAWLKTVNPFAHRKELVFYFYRFFFSAVPSF
jgi:hypothetical protein